MLRNTKFEHQHSNTGTVQDVLKSFCTLNLDMMTEAVSVLESSDKVRALVEEFGKDKENSTKDAKRSVLQIELSAIFKKISAGISKESTREALEELHDFKSKHPEMDIEKSLKCSGASSIFQQYIFRELKKMDEKARDVESSGDDLNNRLQKLRARFMGSGGTTSVVKPKDMTTTTTTTSSPVKTRTSPSRLRVPKIHSPERKGNSLETTSSGRSLASLRERLRNMKSSSSGSLRKPSPPKSKSSSSLLSESSGDSSSSSSLDAMKAKLARLKNMAGQ